MSDRRDVPVPPEEPSDMSPAELSRLETVLRMPAVWVEPDASLQERSLAAWREHLAVERADGRGEAGRSSAGASDAVARVVPLRRWRTRVASGVVGAAAAVLLLGVLWAAGNRSTPPKLRAALAPTSLMPDVSGKAELREKASGWEIRLDTTNLPRLERGRYYEAWLEGPSGIVSIGTFHTGVDVTLWAGVEADEYTTLAITIENEDGNPAQSDQLVLTAPLKP